MYNIIIIYLLLNRTESTHTKKKREKKTIKHHILSMTIFHSQITQNMVLKSKQSVQQEHVICCISFPFNVKPHILDSSVLSNFKYRNIVFLHWPSLTANILANQTAPHTADVFITFNFNKKSFPYLMSIINVVVNCNIVKLMVYYVYVHAVL